MLMQLILTLLGFFICAKAETYAKSISECPSLEPREPPTSIHDLRPDDIKVVMALGDSIMAGLGAKAFSLLEMPLIQEFRGLSFAMGGDPRTVTLPNFLKHYRADLVGASRGNHLVELCHDKFCPPDEIAYRPSSDAFNAAQTGATIANIGMETKYLLEQIRHHRNVNITTDWKILTVFIGNNDICHNACGKKDFDGDFYEEKLWASLERFRQRIPRTLVVLMQLPDVSQVHWFINRHRRCLPAQLFVRMECPCAMASEDDRWSMRMMTAELNDRIVKVAKRINEAASLREPNRELQDFAAIVMPFMRDTDLRDDIPQHFMSKLDCFHPSNTAHKSMALTFWKSLFGKDLPTKLVEETEILCPSENDRFNTELRGSY